MSLPLVKYAKHAVFDCHGISEDDLFKYYNDRLIISMRLWYDHIVRYNHSFN